MLIIGDLHLKENLGYSNYISDGRVGEQKEILDFIIEQSRDEDYVVLCGDQFDKKNNPSEIVRLFVEFIERFGKKKLFIMKGNHEQMSNGKSALDFLREINDKPNWHLFLDGIFSITIGGKKMVFCPYLSNADLGVSNNKDGVKKLMKMLPEGDILFIHHAISDVRLSSGQSTSIFDEVVLPKKELLKKYKLVVGSHVHVPYQKDNLLITGSIFNNEIGQAQKYIWKIDEKTLEVTKIKLPGRSIHGIENPTIGDLDKIEKSSIVKATLTDIKYKNNLDEIKEKLKEFDAHIILEKYPHERKKLHFDEGMLEFDISQLLKTYSIERKISLDSLMKAFNLVK